MVNLSLDYFQSQRKNPSLARVRPTTRFLALRAIRLGLPEATARAVALRRASLNNREVSVTASRRPDRADVSRAELAGGVA